MGLDYILEGGSLQNYCCSSEAFLIYSTMTDIGVEAAVLPINEIKNNLEAVASQSGGVEARDRAINSLRGFSPEQILEAIIESPPSFKERRPHFEINNEKSNLEQDYAEKDVGTPQSIQDANETEIYTQFVKQVQDYLKLPKVLDGFKVHRKERVIWEPIMYDTLDAIGEEYRKPFEDFWRANQFTKNKIGLVVSGADAVLAIFGDLFDEKELQQLEEAKQEINNIAIGLGSGRLDIPVGIGHDSLMSLNDEEAEELRTDLASNEDVKKTVDFAIKFLQVLENKASTS